MRPMVLFLFFVMFLILTFGCANNRLETRIEATYGTKFLANSNSEDTGYGAGSVGVYLGPGFNVFGDHRFFAGAGLTGKYLHSDRDREFSPGIGGNLTWTLPELSQWGARPFVGLRGGLSYLGPNRFRDFEDCRFLGSIGAVLGFDIPISSKWSLALFVMYEHESTLKRGDTGWGRGGGGFGLW